MEKLKISRIKLNVENSKPLFTFDGTERVTEVPPGEAEARRILLFRTGSVNFSWTEAAKRRMLADAAKAR